MKHGGISSIILPIWGYKYLLPYQGFKEIDLTNYKSRKGDIVVFPRVKHHISGHIAMYNGKQWVSDFKQKYFITVKLYKNCKYVIYRHSNIK